MEGHYSLRQAAELLGVSTTTVRNRIDRGELHGVLEDHGVGRKQWWIPIQEVDAETSGMKKETREVVPVSSNLPAVASGAALQEALQVMNTVKGILQDVVQEAVATEMKVAREDMEQRADVRDQKLMEVMRAMQEERRARHKGWWTRLFSS